jgi:predicted RecB family nuclease
MRLGRDGNPLLSPSDVNNFLACPHLPSLDLLRAEGKADPQKGPRPDAELVAQKGIEHEREFLAKLEAEGREVVVIPETDRSTRERAALTEEAMRSGADVIHQAGFADSGWAGYADFVIRVDERSGLGDFSYEAHDAKLAAHPKPYFIFQLVFYTEQIARIQGKTPERMHLILGTNERPSFRPTDFTAYTARVRERYIEYLGELTEGAEPPFPYPVDHCNWCEWWARCKDRRRADDHLSLVAFLGRGQAVRLEDAGVRTVAELAAMPDGAHVHRLPNRTLGGLRQQARLQVEARETGQNLRELLEPEHGRGFARLPEPSAGDVFFDIEGDPYWGDEGIEYLFGTVTDDGTYSELWAHTRLEERAMFERWIDEMSARLEADPGMHIYHYNAYETTAIKKLMQRYGTREREVDELLRRNVFVDLYAVLRQAMRIGKESYSLKSVEDFYAFERDAEVTEAGGSLLAHQEWMEAPSDEKLRAIADYNADDCLSTLGLRDWLLAQRAEAEEQYGVEIDSLPPPEARPISEKRQALIEEIATLTAALTDGLPEDDDAELEGEERARRLMTDVLEYHHREAKPQWWAFFDRLTKTPDELRREDSEAIGGLHLAEDVERREEKNSWLYPLRFDSQEHKLGPGKVVDPATQGTVNLWEVDDLNGLAWVKRGKQATDPPSHRALIPGRPIPQNAQEARLRDLARRVTDHGTEPLGALDAAADLLAARAPRIEGHATGEPLIQGHPDSRSLVDVIARLDSSALFVQGPPGSGKTWTAARVILRLIDQGLRVGVMATAHKAIAKLLDDIEEATEEIPVAFRGLKKASGDNPDSRYESDHFDCSTDNANFPGDPAEHRLLAGTAWLWAREEMRESVDVLFVDEAGQVALADALAISQAARSVVLLGDPQQLAHVSQGTHPRGSGCSVLQHLLGDEETVPPDRGVFLELTYRMHPDVCRVVSEAMYEGRLSSAPDRERQAIDSPGLTGTGPRMLHVEHSDNRQRAPEESELIAREVELLLEGTFTNWKGEVHDLTLEDILIVAPYNAQVRCLRDQLPQGARIGTVDKFQGQQAPVVFFSMTSSSGEDVPRGMDFLFSRNRLNVAVSRAQALSVVVSSPQLLWAKCNSVEQMRLVNTLCRFADAAAGDPVGAIHAHVPKVVAPTTTSSPRPSS